MVPFIKKIQAARKSVIVDLNVEELESFIQAMEPQGLFLCIAAELDIQPKIIKRVSKWK